MLAEFRFPKQLSSTHTPDRNQKPKSFARKPAAATAASSSMDTSILTARKKKQSNFINSLNAPIQPEDLTNASTSLLSTNATVDQQQQQQRLFLKKPSTSPALPSSSNNNGNNTYHHTLRLPPVPVKNAPPNAASYTVPPTLREWRSQSLVEENNRLSAETFLKLEQLGDSHVVKHKDGNNTTRYRKSNLTSNAPSSSTTAGAAAAAASSAPSAPTTSSAAPLSSFAPMITANTLDDIVLRKTLNDAFQGEPGSYLHSVQASNDVNNSSATNAAIAQGSIPKTMIPEEFFIYASSPIQQGFVSQNNNGTNNSNNSSSAIPSTAATSLMIPPSGGNNNGFFQTSVPDGNGYHHAPHNGVVYTSNDGTRFNDEKRQWEKLIFPSLKPTRRVEIYLLAKLMDDMLNAMNDNEKTCENEQEYYDLMIQKMQKSFTIHMMALNEIVRQVYVGCVERGVLLQRILEFFKEYQDVASTVIIQERGKCVQFKNMIRDYENLVQLYSEEKEKNRDEMEKLWKENATLFKEREELKRKKVLDPKLELLLKLMENKTTRDHLLHSLTNSNLSLLELAKEIDQSYFDNSMDNDNNILHHNDEEESQGGNGHDKKKGAAITKSTNKHVKKVISSSGSSKNAKSSTTPTPSKHHHHHQQQHRYHDDSDHGVNPPSDEDATVLKSKYDEYVQGQQEAALKRKMRLILVNLIETYDHVKKISDLEKGHYGHMFDSRLTESRFKMPDEDVTTDYLIQNIKELNGRLKETFQVLKSKVMQEDVGTHISVFIKEPLPRTDRIKVYLLTPEDAYDAKLRDDGFLPDKKLEKMEQQREQEREAFEHAKNKLNRELGEKAKEIEKLQFEMKNLNKQLQNQSSKIKDLDNHNTRLKQYNKALVDKLTDINPAQADHMHNQHNQQQQQPTTTTGTSSTNNTPRDGSGAAAASSSSDGKSGSGSTQQTPRETDAGATQKEDKPGAGTDQSGSAASGNQAGGKPASSQKHSKHVSPLSPRTQSLLDNSTNNSVLGGGGNSTAATRSMSPSGRKEIGVQTEGSWFSNTNHPSSAGSTYPLSSARSSYNSGDKSNRSVLTDTSGGSRRGSVAAQQQSGSTVNTARHGGTPSAGGGGTGSGAAQHGADGRSSGTGVIHHYMPTQGHQPNLGNAKKKNDIKVRNARLAGIVQKLKLKKGQPKTTLWLLRFISNVYKGKLHADSLLEKDSLLSDEEAVRIHSTTPEYVFEHLKQLYGTQKLVDEYAGAIIATIEKHKQQDKRIEVFGKLLTEEWDYRVGNLFLKLWKYLEESKTGPEFYGKQFDDLPKPAMISKIRCLYALNSVKSEIPTIMEKIIEQMNQRCTVVSESEYQKAMQLAGLKTTGVGAISPQEQWGVDEQTARSVIPKAAFFEIVCACFSESLPPLAAFEEALEQAMKIPTGMEENAFDMKQFDHISMKPFYDDRDDATQEEEEEEEE